MNINKKQHSKTFKTIIKIGAAVVLVAGSSGLVFGLTASLSLNEKYVDIKPYQFNEGDKINPRIAADYSSLPSVSYWNCSSTEPINERNNVYKYSTIDEYPNGSLGNYPLDVLSNSPEEMYSCASQILDGATHVTLDKSFNESSYLGLVNWIQQKDKGKFEIVQLLHSKQQGTIWKPQWLKKEENRTSMKSSGRTPWPPWPADRTGETPWIKKKRIMSPVYARKSRRRSSRFLTV